MHDFSSCVTNEMLNVERVSSLNSEQSNSGMTHTGATQITNGRKLSPFKTDSGGETRFSSNYRGFEKIKRPVSYVRLS